MYQNIKDLLCSHQPVEAFWLLSENLQDAECRRLMLQLLAQKNNVALLRDSEDRIHALADGGDPYMQYAYARIHEVLAPEPDSVRIMEKYCTAAMDAGIADARFSLALSYRDADFGERDMARFHEEADRALADGSARAAQLRIRDLIYGQDGAEADPREAIRIAESRIDGMEMPDPAYFRLMGLANVKLGRTGAALDNFENAIRYGDSSSFWWEAIYSCGDQDGNIVDEEAFRAKMERARGYSAADAYLEYAMLYDDERYGQLDAEEKARVTAVMREQLTAGARLGESSAAYFLASCCEDGRMGFTQDFAEAVKWYSRGACLRDPFCYEALSRMILEDGTAAGEFDEEYGYECAYRALVLEGDTLETVIRGYRNGFLTHHAAPIEQEYLPEYERQLSDSMDEHSIDEDGYPVDYEPEYEVEEDDWSMDPDIEIGISTCLECVEAAEKLLRKQDSEL